MQRIYAQCITVCKDETLALWSQKCAELFFDGQRASRIQETNFWALWTKWITSLASLTVLLTDRMQQRSTTLGQNREIFDRKALQKFRWDRHLIKAFRLLVLQFYFVLVCTLQHGTLLSSGHSICLFHWKWPSFHRSWHFIALTALSPILGWIRLVRKMV